MADAKPDVLAIFTESLARESEAERSKYLDDACQGDPQVRGRVEKLLRAHSDAGNFLGGPSPVVAATIDFSSNAELPGSQIGPYRLLEQIGEGGMGVVYHASQREPIHRKVALKIIKPGMDTHEVVKRFEAERQALAMMDHPNIAKVFDGGVTDTGRPYFAMELVRGKPITDYCDREQLSTRERLTLLVAVCQGVQHAHQKGIIHRDIKPSNILIKVYDVRPVPVVIDFGIAKAMGQQLSEHSLHTAFDQMVGTPLYMSPEQAGQSGVDVDTRSDIYSLGVLLYELLTGCTPFEKDALRKSGVDEMRRIICEVDPPRPSARVSTLQAADLSTVCDRRHTDPRKLSSQLRGELDWIVMKTLEKDRDRRYATANDLAADIERYLHDEPVQACPPSAAYRFTKFARRNRTALITSGLVALALIVGTGVSIWQAIRATHAELAAIAERDEKERAEQRTAQALQTAEERLQFGRQAVDDMYTQFAEKWLAQRAELTAVQKQFLEKALAFYQRLATEESDDSTVRFETAKAQQRMGAIQSRLGQHSEAEASLYRACELLQQLVREKPDDPQYRDWLAQTQSKLGPLLALIGRTPEAERELRSALETHQTLAAQFPGEAKYQMDLAHSHERLGDLLEPAGRSREAEAAYRQSIALCASLLANSPDDRDRRSNLAGAQLGLARVVDADKPAEAEALLRAAIDAYTTLVADDPKNVDYRFALAASHNNLGNRLEQLGLPLESEASFRQAQSMYQELAAEVPKEPLALLQVATNLDNLARCLEAAGKGAEAEQFGRQSREIADKLAADYPEVPAYQFRAFNQTMILASNLIKQGKLEEARGALEPIIPTLRGALKSRPDDAEYHRGLSWALHELGVAEFKSGQLDEAATHLRSALEIDELIVAETPTALTGWESLRSTAYNLALVQSDKGRLPEAEVSLRRALEASERLVTDAPGVPQHRMKLAEISDGLGVLCHGAKKLPEAQQAGRRAVEIQRALAADGPDDVEVRTWAGAYLSNLADTLMDAGQLAEARQLLEQAVVHQRAALKLDPAHVQSQDFLNIHLVLLTKVLVLVGDEEAAAKAAQELAQLGLAGGDSLVATVAQASEARIAQALQEQHNADRSPQRRESSAEAHFLVAKALIREAVLRAPDDPTQWMIADILTTAPEPVRDPDLALQLAQRAVELKPDDGMCLQSLGWALYRKGDYRGAIEAIKKTSSGGEDSFVRAMALWQLGEKTQAQAIFERTNEWLKVYEQACEARLKQGTQSFPPPAQLKRLQAEAAALLGVTLPTVEPAAEPAAKVEEATELPKTAPAPESAKEEEQPK
jgi:eukaryotic-like serine/threonine-protein kinase